MTLFRQRPSYILKKVQVGKHQEKAQSEKDPHSKNRGGGRLFSDPIDLAT